MSKSRAHVRHIYPPDDPAHTQSPYCACKPNKRTRGVETVWVHNALARGKAGPPRA